MLLLGSLLSVSAAWADYTIDYGDGSSETIVAAPWTGGALPAIATHTYTNDGIYAVTLTGETDCDGDGVVDATPVTSSIIVNVGNVVQSFDYGDGSAPLVSATSPCTTSLTPNHAYATPGTYTATYRAFDDGGILITKSIEIIVAGADHFSISHDGTGINCQAETVTITAHDSSHLVTGGYIGTISLSTNTAHGDWSLIAGLPGNLSNLGNGQATYTFAGSENGVVVLGLKDLIAEIVDIQVTDGSAVEDPQEDPALSFAAAGFNFLADTVVNAFAVQTAGKSSSVPPGNQALELQAVNTNAQTGACEALLVGATTVDLAFECIDPTSCQGNLLALNAQTVMANNKGTANLNYAGISLDFGTATDTTAAFTLNYADVGALRLHARYQLLDENGSPSGVYLSGQSTNLVFRPASFTLSVPGNPAAADANGGAFKKAGESFSMQVTARSASGAITPNYGQENLAESVRLLPTLIAPSGGDTPPLNGSFNAFGSDCSGNVVAGVACGQFVWPEVGIIDLSPGVGDADYLGGGDVTGTSSGNVGRFIAGSLSIAPVVSAMLGDACMTGSASFTYLGQDFGYLIDPQFTISALSTTGLVLKNYDNDFWKYPGTLAGRSYSNASSISASPTLSTIGSTAMTGLNDYNGLASLTLTGDRLTFAKPGAALAPFVGQVNLDLSAADLTDTDGACYDPDNDGTCNPYSLLSIGTTEQRYGRLVLQNAYGPEVLALTLPLIAEYFTGSAYAVNSVDDCTVYNVANLVLSNYQGSLTAGATTPAGVGVFTAGLGSGLTLSPPGVGKDGSVDLLYDLDTAGSGWLKENGVNPTGKVTFGIFKGNERLIYMRESIQ